MRTWKKVIRYSLALVTVLVLLQPMAVQAMGEDQLTEAIPVEGDFQLSMYFGTKPIDDGWGKTEALWLELQLGTDLLALDMGNHYAYLNGEMDMTQDGYWYNLNDGFEGFVGTDEYVVLDLRRTGDTITVNAKRAGLFRTQSLHVYEMEIKGLAEKGTVSFSGDNLQMKDFIWTTEPRELATPEVPERGFWHNVLLWVASLTVYLLLRKVLVTPVQKKFGWSKFSGWMSAVAFLSLSYGALTLWSRKNFFEAEAFLQQINRIFAYAGSSLTLPVRGTLLSSTVGLILLIVLGLGLLLIGWAICGGNVLIDTVALPLGMLLNGLLIFVTLNPIFHALLQAFRDIGKQWENLLLIPVLILIIAGSDAPQKKEEPQKEESFWDTLSAIDAAREAQENRPEPKPEVQVWTGSGLGKDYMKVSEDGQRYFDKRDGKWHRVDELDDK